MHLGERECSIQRRHQKLIEESPSPAVDAKLRAELGARVVDRARTSRLHQRRHRGISDGRRWLDLLHRNERAHSGGASRHGNGYRRGPDQIADSPGRRRKARDVVGQLAFRGHGIECRINAEDPETFVPSAGRITAFQHPGRHRRSCGYRRACRCRDFAVLRFAGRQAHRLWRDRAEAIARMRRALEMFVVEGIKTSIPLHRKIMADPDFSAGRLDTHFLDRFATSRAG